MVQSWFNHSSRNSQIVKIIVLKKLQQLYPNMKESDLETLDAIITDKELEELLESHGQQSK